MGCKPVKSLCLRKAWEMEYGSFMRKVRILIQNEKLVTSIGFTIDVTLHDALSVLKVWERSAPSFKASISQMSRFYSFIWKELDSSNETNMAILRSGSFIFVPLTSASSSEVVSGVLLSPQEVFWHDSMIHPKSESKMLSNLYPSLQDFFVNECGVSENPPLLDYLAFLRHLSTEETPSEAAKKVFDIFVMWIEGLTSGALSVEEVEMLKRNLEEKEMKVLPTSRDKWVSLHPSFGLVCWCDDEKLADEFEVSNILNFFCLCELTDEEKAMLQVKVSAFMKVLGIPALSEVVTREAIYYWPVDNNYETSLVSWVLPYAQRYISNAYHERYIQLKQSGFGKLNRLQIVVVEKLFYKNVIRRSNLASKKRHDCSCLLQDGILYATCESDSHSIFMELTRFLINGDAELHLANFLHLITTMTESGSKEEHIETFILNSQKVPKLAEEEPIWSIQPITLNMETSATIHATKRTTKHSSSSRGNKNWPPASWQTAPKMQDVVNVEPSLVDQDGPTSFSQNDKLSLGQVNVQQALLTGRRGEEVAFDYYSKKDWTKLVKWVNEASETGLPYDIEVCDHNNRKEYIEVKTTNSASKDWFEISVKEWQFAVKKGESFSIARVVFLGDKTAQVSIYKNPAKLCRDGELKLAVLMSKPQMDEFVV